MKAKIIHYEGQEEIVDEELELTPVVLTEERLKFNNHHLVGTDGSSMFEINFSRSPMEVKGYVYPLEDGKFLFISEEEWKNQTS